MTTPTPGQPLSEADVSLLTKLIDTLKPFAEVADTFRQCHVVEICAPTPDNPSRQIMPMPREWFERAADDLEAIVIQLHHRGVLSEGQASKITSLDRVEVRKLADAYRPHAPVSRPGDGVEGERDMSGETFAGFRVAAWRYRQAGETDKLPHHYAEHWSTPGASAWGIQRLFTEDQLLAALTPPAEPVSRPAGEGEGEAVARADIERAIENNLRISVSHDGEEIVVHTDKCVDAILETLSNGK